ncbi:hypothetical protein GQ600_4096 [Phytophthora cactorum]|nr:hypothetical protein GQ600_4096 [Phytophthora cactorum]
MVLRRRRDKARCLSDQQVQELVQVATAKQLTNKFGYECWTRTIQRVLVEHTGHKRRRDDGNSLSSANGCGEETNARVDEEQIMDNRATATNDTAVPVADKTKAVVARAASEALRVLLRRVMIPLLAVASLHCSKQKVKRL